MTKFLIAGGAGYVGTALVTELLAAGHCATVFDRFSLGEASFARVANDPRLRLVQGDVRTVEASVVRGHDVVIDLAGLSSDDAADREPALREAINHGAAVRLAELARQTGVSRLLYSSSCAVYGAAASGGVRTEESEPLPVSLYAKTKVRVEETLRAMASPSFTVTALRQATVYGLSPRMRFDAVVNRMTLHAFREKRIRVHGGGKQWRPLVHVRDVAGAFMLAAHAAPDRVNAQVLNVGSETHSVAEIASIVASVVPAEIEHTPGAPDARSYRVSFDKIKGALSFAPRFTVIDGVKEIYAALQSDAVGPPSQTRSMAWLAA